MVNLKPTLIPLLRSTLDTLSVTPFTKGRKTNGVVTSFAVLKSRYLALRAESRFLKNSKPETTRNISKEQLTAIMNLNRIHPLPLYQQIRAGP